MPPCETPNMLIDASIVVSIISLTAALAVALLEYRSRREIESIKLRLDKQRLSFETEHRILAEAWKAASEFHLATLDLRPNLAIHHQGESVAERLKRTMGAFESARAKLISTATASRPFYPVEIHDVVGQIVEIAQEEWWDRVFHGESCVDFPDPAEAIATKSDRRTALSTALEVLSERIRARVSA